MLLTCVTCTRTCVFLQVCCHCFDLLTQLSTKATVQVNQVNAHLYTHVTDLSNVEVSVNSQAVGSGQLHVVATNPPYVHVQGIYVGGGG